MDHRASAKIDEAIRAAVRDAITREQWRATALFSRDELERLISDPRVPLDRRVQYALEGIAALRLGEAVGLRWRHYDAAKEPLGQLLIATSYNKGRTKTKVARRMPVHSTLAAMLAEWKMHGWPAMMGRIPTAHDLLVPLPPKHADRRRKDRASEGMRSKTYVFKRLRDDLAMLKLRHRRGHDLRRTMISLARTDGARKDILEPLFAALAQGTIAPDVRRLRRALLGMLGALG